MNSESGKLSEHLEAVARLMELDSENPHKVRAYRNASLQVRGRTSQELSTPTNISGIGPSIGATIREFLFRGSSTRLEALSTKWPVEILSLMTVQGVGPKTAVALFEDGVTSFDELLTRAKKGQLDVKLTARVLAAEAQSKRVPIELALNVSSKIREQLIKAGARRVEVCGSIRRHTPSCKDIDIVAEVTSETTGPLKKAFEQLGHVLWSGPVRSSIMITDSPQPLQCDLWMVHGWNWGAMLCYATGSKIHNQRLRGMLKSRGMRMNEYGIYLPLDGVDLDARKVAYGPLVATSGGELVAKRIGGTDEEDVYKILGIPYVHPSQRSE